MRHAPQPLLWSPPASAAAAMSQRHPSASPQIDRSALKVGFRSENAAGAAADPSGDASSFLCSPMRREATRGCSARRGRRRLRRARVGRSGGTLPLRAAPAGAPTTAVAPPLMEGRSAPLPPRRRWEGHWWWPGRPSAAARGARAAVAACRRTTSKCPLTTSKCPLRRPATPLLIFLLSKILAN